MGSTFGCIRDMKDLLGKVDWQEATSGPFEVFSQKALPCQVTLDRESLAKALAQYPVFLPDQGLFCRWDWSTAGSYHS